MAKIQMLRTKPGLSVPAVLGLVAVAWQALALSKALRDGRRLASQTQCQVIQRPANGRVLVLGDSTGVGVGAGSLEASLPGLLAAEFPRHAIVNVCSNGARVVEALSQVRGLRMQANRFDVALVMAGGNDVIRMTPLKDLLSHTDDLLQELQQHARHVVWLGCADLGTAPALKPPLSWVASWRSRHVTRALRSMTDLHGVTFIDFGTAAHSRMFTLRPDRYFAEDGLHPSAASYQHCFRELNRRVPLARWLAT